MLKARIAAASCLLILLGSAPAVFATEEEELAKYINDVTVDLKKNWHPAKRVKKAQAVASINIKKDGTTASPKIVESSGDKAFDESVITTLKSEKKVKPFPQSCKQPEIVAQITFVHQPSK
jgi:TonB family protein